MLSRVLKLPHGSTAVCGAQFLPPLHTTRVHLSPSGTPVGSFSEDAMFELASSHVAACDTIGRVSTALPVVETQTEELFEADIEEDEHEAVPARTSSGCASIFGSASASHTSNSGAMAIKHQFPLFGW